MHMTGLLATLQDALFDWLVHGLGSFSGWQIVAYTFVTTHITIAAVTNFLHRSQAHRLVELHALPSHLFRCWLWLSTGIVKREWVAVHRKHHAAGGGCDHAERDHREPVRVNGEICKAFAELVAMRQQLRQLWTPSSASGEQLVADLQACLKTAEASGSATLHEFAAMLRAIRA